MFGLTIDKLESLSNFSPLQLGFLYMCISSINAYILQLAGAFSYVMMMLGNQLEISLNDIFSSIWALCI
jgi:hypothetical protein